MADSLIHSRGPRKGIEKNSSSKRIIASPFSGPKAPLPIGPIRAKISKGRILKTPLKRNKRGEKLYKVYNPTKVEPKLSWN